MINETKDDTLRVRLPSSLKDKLISESANLNIDLSELVRQQLTIIDRKKNFIGCLDCHTIHTPYYMVKDSIWLSAMPEYSEVKSRLINTCVELCFNCLETRLGRELHIEDFDLTLPINYSIRQGYAMGMKEGLDSIARLRKELTK